MSAATRIPAQSRAKRVKVRPRDLLALYERSAGKCGICGETVTASDASVDHIIPIARGGSDALDNRQLAHHRCNVQKNTRLAGEPSTVERRTAEREAHRTEREAAMTRAAEERSRFRREAAQARLQLPSTERSTVGQQLAAMRRPHEQQCASCRRTFTAVGRGLYCSATCRTRAERQRKRKRAPRDEEAS